MRKLSAALIILFGLAHAALAQQGTPTNPIQCAYNAAPPAIASGFFGYVQCDVNGKIITSGGGGGGGGGVAGPVTQTSVSITNASTTLSAAAAFGNFGKVCVPATASTGVWVRWDGGTAGVVPPAEYIPPGQCDSWIKASGYLPNQQWNAISNSAATIAVTLIGN